VKVVLRDDVASLGRKGDLVEVSDGYARNYLVPQGLALTASDGAVGQAESMRRSRTVRDKKERDGAEATAKRLSGGKVTITARAGDDGRLFGSVTGPNIAEAIEAQLGVEVDRRRLVLDEPLKELGPHDVPIRLHTDVTAVVQVEVVAG
jgi:large subunit ribosomal protein L9